MNRLPRSLAPAAAFLARHFAIVALAVFAAVGVAVFDDYGVSHDEWIQRTIGYASFNYILGDEGALGGYNTPSDRFYGVAFEVPLIAVERLLGLEDSRDIHLSRHLLTHLFFLAGGFFAWLLARRLFGGRLAALAVMLIFLLHPRLYAHSFFNSKDLPFLSMFMVALYLAHRAFRRDAVWAFALCGAGAALLANTRVIGFMLLPAVLGMLALDAIRGARRERRRGLANAGAFCAAFGATLYASWPLLWRNPLNLTEAIGTMSQHPVRVNILFRGELVRRWEDVPWDFIPTWALATTPPAALIIAALGIAYLARLCAAERRRDALSNSTARFGLLALACLVLPIAAAIALDSNLYHDWRQMYFLYAPFCVLAAFGLRALAEIPKPAVRAGAFALAALGISAAAIQTVSLHPYQADYFNIFVNKSGLGERWTLDYWDASSGKEALETLLAAQPEGHIAVIGAEGTHYNLNIIPADDRRRLHVNPNFPSFQIVHRRGMGDPSGEASIWTRSVYGVPIVSILDVRAESAAAFHDAYAAARASEPDASAGGFDMYADGGELAYVKDGCGEDDARGWFALAAFPVDQSDLPLRTRRAGLDYETAHFQLRDRGAIFGGKCVIVQDLPDFPISHIETWRDIPGEGAQWSAFIPLDGHYERHRRIVASLSGESPAMRSGFDVYARDGALIYVKSPCAEYDARGRFFLSAFPADAGDLPQSARRAGLEHEPRNFDFHRGAIFDGKCAMIQDLPAYRISRVETGQWTDGEGELWSGEILFDGYYDRYRRALASVSGEQPAIRSDFAVYPKDGALIYVKEGCDERDARGRFFLSAFPSDPSDLPQSSREAGLEHESLNFDFAQHGAILDGKCAIIRDLPDYPMRRIETGQWTDGEGELWSGRLAVGD